MAEDGSNGLLIASLAAGAAAIAATALIVSSNQGATPVAKPKMVPWLGGVSRENVDALAFLFMSENEKASPLVWSMQAVAANNWAVQLARGGRTQIRSIADMLRSGVVDKRRQYGLPWGLQYDKRTRVKRWAATTAGNTPTSVPMRAFELAERLLAGTTSPAQFVGRRGEVAPAADELARINSFLQFESFGETVQRQTGAAGATVEAVLKDWGRTRLVSSVEGVNFYEVRG